MWKRLNECLVKSCHVRNWKASLTVLPLFLKRATLWRKLVCGVSAPIAATPSAHVGAKLLLFYLGGDFQSQSIQPNKACGIVLIISLGRIRLHRGNFWIVEA